MSAEDEENPFAAEHAAIRNRILALCEADGYGAIIDVAARGWAAKRQPGADKQWVSMWLRYLADQIEYDDYQCKRCGTFNPNDHGLGCTGAANRSPPYELPESQPSGDDMTSVSPRPHHLKWNGTEWVDERCGCRYHPDDDKGTHGGAPHVHLCMEHHVGSQKPRAT